MALKLVIDKLEDVDAAVRDEYKEHTDPKSKAVTYVLDLDGPIDSHPAAKQLKTELGARRISEKAATDKLKLWEPVLSNRTPDDLISILDRLPELEAAAEGKIDEAKLNTLVDAKLKIKVGPLEREILTLKTQLGEKDTVITGYKQGEVKRTVSGEVLKAAKGAKVQDVALEDVELYGERLFEVTEDNTVVTKDGVGVTPGLTPKQWLEDIQNSNRRPHWFGATVGGGATGSRSGGGFSGPNPWAADSWNMTEQGRVVRENRARADKMASAAGTTVGGPRPKSSK